MRIIVHLLFIILSLQLVGCNSNRLVQVSAAVVLVDHEDIGLIAQKVCASSGESDDARIGHISTISKLKGFFEGIEKDHPLYDCYSKNKDSLELLERIVTKYNENVCSNEKVDLIEEYHNLHIETEGKPKNVPAASLRVFFMNYAFEISFRCYAVFSENFQYSSGFEPLNGLPEAFERGLGRLDNGSIKHILSRLTEQFDGRFWMARYDDALMVGGIPRASILKRLKKRTANQEFNDELDPITGQRIRIKLLVGSSDEMDHLKDRCRNSMKPIYSKLTLPIVRLSSLGYAIRGERFERELKELKESKDAAGWYAVTKLCELILSIRFYENPSIVGVNGGVVVLDKEKEDEIKRKLWYTSGDNGRLVEEEQPIRFQVPVPASMVDDDVLQLAAENDEQTLVKKIELNLKDRNRACGRHLRVPSLIFLD